MDVKLNIVGAKTGTKEILVKRPKILGRARGIGIVIPHPMVSERHCLLFEHAGMLMVQDLNSEQGTFIGGRKIVMAPLPPGAEFSVGPLTLRAEYAYSGNLDSLPKTIYDEPEVEAPVTPLPAVQEPIPDSPHIPPLQTGEVAVPHENVAPAEPIAATPEFPSFFGFGNHVEFPAVTQPVALPEVSFAPPAAPIAPAPQVITPTVAVTKPQPPMPPPLPKVVQAPSPEAAPAPNFEDFASHVEAILETNFEPAAESETGIAGLNVDQPISASLPAQPTPEKKPLGGSLLDYFSKRPARRKRVARVSPDSIVPAADTNPTSAAPAKPAPPVAPNAWSEALTTPAAPLPPLDSPLEINPLPPEEVDDDLSSFFKKLG
jgi:hypothetical protein